MPDLPPLGGWSVPTWSTGPAPNRSSPGGTGPASLPRGRHHPGLMQLSEEAHSSCHDRTFLSPPSALKLYVSSDLGKKWTLLQERVTKDHVFW